MDEVQAIEIVNINPGTELSLYAGEPGDFKYNIKIEFQLYLKLSGVKEDPFCLDIYF